jgi:hypothetical protein
VEHHDLFVRRVRDALALGDQLFVELLAGPEADVLDLNIYNQLRLKTTPSVVSSSGSRSLLSYTAA